VDSLPALHKTKYLFHKTVFRLWETVFIFAVPKNNVMRKIASLLLFCLCFLTVQASQAQNEATDFPKLLAYFKEVQAGNKIEATEVSKSINKDIDKQLAWQFLMEKNSFMKPEEVFAHPIAYFKKSDNIVVLLYATGKKGNAVFYNIGMQSYDLKKGKLITGLAMVATFNDKGNASAEIAISNDKKSLMFGSKSPLGNAPVQVEVSNAGKLKIIE
jgi:hypothetical protein